MDLLHFLHLATSILEGTWACRGAHDLCITRPPGTGSLADGKVSRGITCARGLDIWVFSGLTADSCSCFQPCLKNDGSSRVSAWGLQDF